MSALIPPQAFAFVVLIGVDSFASDLCMAASSLFMSQVKCHLGKALLVLPYLMLLPLSPTFPSKITLCHFFIWLRLPEIVLYVCSLVWSVSLKLDCSFHERRPGISAPYSYLQCLEY